MRRQLRLSLSFTGALAFRSGSSMQRTAASPFVLTEAEDQKLNETLEPAASPAQGELVLGSSGLEHVQCGRSRAGSPYYALQVSGIFTGGSGSRPSR